MKNAERVFELLTASPFTVGIVGDPEHSEYILVEIPNAESAEFDGSIEVYRACGLGLVGFIGFVQGKPRAILQMEIDLPAMDALTRALGELLAPKLAENLKGEADWLTFARSLYGPDTGD